jgi:hypothetical protein
MRRSSKTNPADNPHHWTCDHCKEVVQHLVLWSRQQWCRPCFQRRYGDRVSVPAPGQL